VVHASAWYSGIGDYFPPGVIRAGKGTPAEHLKTAAAAVKRVTVRNNADPFGNINLKNSRRILVTLVVS